ncbi:MAG: sensor histidine kinase [Verrucomicrobiota bacterium]
MSSPKTTLAFWITALLISGSGSLALELPSSVDPLRTVDEVRLLTYEESRMAPPVMLRVTVVSHLPDGFDGQDNTGGLFFDVRPEQIPPLGELVEVHGNVTGGFYGPYIIVDEVRARGQRNLPKALNFRPDFVQTGLGDNRLIKIEGLVVDVTFDESGQSGEGLLVNGQTDIRIRFQNQLDEFEVDRIRRLVGSWVQLTGSGAPLFNDGRQRIGSDIICSSNQLIEVVNEGITTKHVPLGDIGRWDSRSSSPGLIRTLGQVTLIEGPRSFVVQADNHGARVKSLREHDLQVGDTVALKGLPDTEGYFVGLRYADVVPSSNLIEVAPPLVEELALSRDNPFQLVSLSGRAVDKEGRILNLETKEGLFPVSLPVDISVEDLPEAGSEIEITGVKLVDADVRGELRSVTVMMRHLDDLRVLATPSWWNPQRYWTAILILATGILLFLVWTLALNRRVSKQTALIETQIQSNAALEERNRIARELHDTLSQGFSGVGYQLASLDNHLTSNPEKAREKLTAAREMVELGLSEARDSLTGLRVPTAAESLEFPDKTLSIMEDRCHEASITLIITRSDEIDRLELDVETAYACHRILLEGVANVIRHSGAKQLQVDLGQNGGSWQFSLRDDGKGFDPQSTPDVGHYGLQGMKERASEIEAQLEIESSKRGTNLTLTLPPPQS